MNDAQANVFQGPGVSNDAERQLSLMPEFLFPHILVAQSESVS
jgi:hypothetical protein